MDGEMSPKQIVELILFEQRVNTNKFAKKIGTSATNIYDIVSGKIKAISNEMADKIRTAYPCYSKPWLMTGEGYPHVDDATIVTEEDGLTPAGSTNVNINGAQTTGDIVKICNAFISEMAAQRESYTKQISDLIQIIDKRIANN